MHKFSRGPRLFSGYVPDIVRRVLYQDYNFIVPVELDKSVKKGGSHVIVQSGRPIAESNKYLRSIDLQILNRIICSEIKPASAVSLINRWLYNNISTATLEDLGNYAKSLGTKIDKISGHKSILGLNEQLINDINILLVGVKPKSILNYCGDSASHDALKERFPNAVITTIDKLPEIITDRYELVIASQCLHHVDYVSVIKQLGELTESGGYILVRDLDIVTTNEIKLADLVHDIYYHLISDKPITELKKINYISKELMYELFSEFSMLYSESHNNPIHNVLKCYASVFQV